VEGEAGRESGVEGDVMRLQRDGDRAGGDADVARREGEKPCEIEGGEDDDRPTVERMRPSWRTSLLKSATRTASPARAGTKVLTRLPAP
jgi:hypothetical protein